MGLIWRIFKWGLIGLVLLVVVLLAPIAYVEEFCRANVNQVAYSSVIEEPEFQRKEANSYLTYPEWHIVYAYEGLAKVLESGDEHSFEYFKSVSGFWQSLCALNRTAGRHGGGDFNTRSTVYTIGASFTFEMMMKALYEETLGRLFVLIRGAEKTPQDIYSAKMAADYAAFLQQVPWYKFDFDGATAQLWKEPLTDDVRGWERRLALGGEWKAKSAYAGVIAQAVDAAGQAQLRIRSVVTRISRPQLEEIDGIEVITETPDHTIIETPRYRKFTKILQAVAAAGGQVIEIAGNDDIMVSAIEEVSVGSNPLGFGNLFSRISRDGYDSNRILVTVKVSDLAALLSSIEVSGRQLEHIYDY